MDLKYSTSSGSSSVVKGMIFALLKLFKFEYSCRKIAVKFHKCRFLANKTSVNNIILLGNLNLIMKKNILVTVNHMEKKFNFES